MEPSWFCGQVGLPSINLEDCLFEQLRLLLPDTGSMDHLDKALGSESCGVEGGRHLIVPKILLKQPRQVARIAEQMRFVPKGNDHLFDTMKFTAPISYCPGRGAGNRASSCEVC